MVYPNIWGKDIIFAFSGIEGKTDVIHPFIAGTQEEFGSFVLRIDDGINFGFRKTNPSRKPEPLIVASDIIITKNPPISIVFIEKNAVIGRYTNDLVPFLENSTPQADGKYLVSSLLTKVGAIILLIDNKSKKFSLVYDPESKEKARRKAIMLLNRISISKEIKKKLDFFEKAHLPEFKNKKEKITYLKALSVIKVNCESPQGKIKYTWTTPDRWPHRYMWFWDSAFHTFGNYFISPSLAEQTLLAVLSCQREDGFISITMSPEKGRVYENVTQPPLFAWAGYELFKKTGNRDFLEVIYENISKYIRWLYKNRDRDQDGLLEWRIEKDLVSKCGESGMDNSPRFDEIKPNDPIAAIDLNCFAINEMVHLAKIAEILKRQKESSIWKTLADEKRKLVDTFLWDEKDGFYYDRKQNGEFIRIKTVSSFLPLFACISDPNKAITISNKIKDKNLFWTDFPLPSVAKNEKSFSKDMWRGGTWLNYNFMIYRGLLRYGFRKLARQLALKTKSGVEKWYLKNGSIFEFYDPDNKIPPKQLPRKDWLGKKGWVRTISDYQWSAAIYVAILNELRKRKK
ncbi:MAG: hypothetical protein NC906_04985 [Candidatus Omnitrophica bacterium]|nr:hypothetical protein [Candidatus Omnitrophota bacterium]